MNKNQPLTRSKFNLAFHYVSKLRNSAKRFHAYRLGHFTPCKCELFSLLGYTRTVSAVVLMTGGDQMGFASVNHPKNNPRFAGRFRQFAVTLLVIPPSFVLGPSGYGHALFTTLIRHACHKRKNWPSNHSTASHFTSFRD